MHVAERHRKLVLQTPRYKDVLAAIPHAQVLENNGQRLVAVEHGIDEVRVLKNMGFAHTPPPIYHYYNWPARFKPMQHQKETSSFMLMYDRALCLNAPGTGKTLSMLWAADFLMREKIIRRVLIIAPLSTLQPVWGHEIMHHIPHRRYTLITGARKYKLKKLAAVKDGQFAVINHDGFTALDYRLFKEYDLVIYDEATALKTPGARRYKYFARFMRDHDPRLWMLTGTPIAQHPTDAWTMARLVNSPTVPQSFTEFKNLVMARITQFKWVPRPEALGICRSILQPSIRFSLDECHELPETIYISRDCELTKAQEKAYKVLQEDAILTLGSQTVSAANAAVLLGKLLQLCCGVMYDEDKNPVVVNAKNRTDTLDEILNEIGAKTIIYVPLRAVQNHLEKHLKDRGYDVGVVHGGVTGSKRDKVFNDFQNTDRIQILLAHPKVAAHGLTLTRSKNIIWYAPIYSLEQYEQANARIRRISTQGKTRVYHIAATGFERELYRRLQHKKAVLENFLNLVQGINE